MGGGLQVLFRGLDSPSAYAANGTVYVVIYAGSQTWIVPRPSPAGHETVQVAVAIGPDNLAGDVDDLLVAGGRVWVTTTRGGTTDLLWIDSRFHSRSISSIHLSGPVAPRRNTGPLGAVHPVGSMAVAGGWLWVVAGQGQLDRVSLTTGRVTERVTRASILMANGISIGADPSGKVLLISQDGYIQRLDPRTGAALKTAGPFPHGSLTPEIGGVIDGGAWITSASTIGGGYVERIDVRTLKPALASHWSVIHGLLRAQLLDRILWVTPTGQARGFYCADPATGRPRVESMLLGPHPRFLTVDRQRIYWVPDTSNPRREEILSAPIDPRCR